MPEMHLRQPQFVYSTCGPFFTRHKERIKEFKCTGDICVIFIEMNSIKLVSTRFCLCGS